MASDVVNFLGSIYCERADDPAIWAEPFNALSNLFFIFAAVMAGISLAGILGKPINSPTCPWRRNTDLWLLVIALFAIGIGSGFWHLHPSAATILMDVIPITLFIHIYLISTLRRLYNQTWRRTMGYWLIFLFISVIAQIKLPPDLFHGTVMYLPTYFTMVILTFTLAKRDQAIGKRFAIITTVWSFSLIFRTIDLEICSQFAIGTHFLWHTLNAWVLYQLLMVLIRNGMKR